ncbi:hypothetical protein SAMN02745355_1166 [Picrophilus oshimae DSM 9789]|uniref:Uncharacterized protein n=1 Tax=Picrophilus torridus (strain ATCC 700027 / DSM 9790 / JCM 10055 / NBRC 100828 / KAW 2/3) TaxID=1122961 RepID=A0A8G2L7L4_PICTO|nr:hypothetical protein SAMN02745355_1166 [Picrophilus oshimae DSM 9789]
MIIYVMLIDIKFKFICIHKKHIIYIIRYKYGYYMKIMVIFINKVLYVVFIPKLNLNIIYFNGIYFVNCINCCDLRDNLLINNLY